MTLITKLKKICILLLMSLAGNTMAIDSSELQELAVLNATASVLAYSSVSVSTNELTFNILGTPGAYTSTDIVELTVETNQSTWGVYAQASNLVHVDADIAPLSAQRLSFSVDDSTHFTELKNNALILQGLVNQAPKPIKLNFRLTTTWQDMPGVYKGKITIAFLNNP